MPTTAEKPGNELAQSLSEAEKAAQEVAAAQEKAAAAQRRHEEAQRLADARQKQAQELWARETVAGHPDTVRHHNQEIAAARKRFEASVVDDPTMSMTTFLEWVEALAGRHASEQSFDLARSILGQPAARLTPWPEPRYMEEVNRVVQARTDEALEDAIDDEKRRRMRAFSGQESPNA